ncbi:neutral/alkaline non-lysosomal ceramidase N-terminal domain-containing protein [Prevotella sp.]|uniref:neutral/alkaline non-lysosomal ceramidase N-terminal domain-containing protein n=2 Tax=Prevotella sp. TaxID=59823 RepID=UPI0027E2D493|nr:neutral/alkaline non-lysosomal ceramidase N-terminal domain-containing protein [Prevotella sp.]
MKRLLMFVLLLALVSTSIITLAMSTKKTEIKKTQLKVGAARQNITPPNAMFPFDALHEACPYTAVHDSLYARAIVMDNGEQRAVLVEIDEVQVPEPLATRKAVAVAAGVSESNVIICVSHTHSTLHPNGEDKRLQQVIDRIRTGAVEATRQAVASLQPATISFARTKAFVNINNGEAEQSAGQYSNTAFSDKTLDIVRFSSMSDKPIALVVNYPTHAEVMFRSISYNGGYEVSGDLPGRTAYILEKANGTNGNGAPIVLATAGAEADQQPLLTSRQHTSTMGYIDQGVGGWAIVDALAHRLTDAINEAVKTMPIGKSNVSIETMSTEAVVPGQYRHQNRETGEITDEESDDVHIPISRITVDDIAFAGVGADLASSVGVEVRDASPIANTMLITCTAGAVGYILPDAMYDHYTHAVFGSRVRKGYSTKAIINAFAKTK